MIIHPLTRVLPQSADPTLEEGTLALDHDRLRQTAEGVILTLPSITLRIEQVKTTRGFVFTVETSTPLSEGNHGDMVYGVASDGMALEEDVVGRAILREHYIFWATAPRDDGTLPVEHTAAVVA